MWLKYENEDNVVTCLKCSLYGEFEEKIRSCKNFSQSFVTGSTNLRTPAFKDHTKSEIHDMAMKLLKKKQGAKFFEYAPKLKSIALLPKMDAGTRHIMRAKFDIVYFLAKEKLVFANFESLCKLEKRHGVMLCDMYINDHGCAMFVKFIAYELRPRHKGP